MPDGFRPETTPHSFPSKRSRATNDTIECGWETRGHSCVFLCSSHGARLGLAGILSCLPHHASAVEASVTVRTQLGGCIRTVSFYLLVVGCFVSSSVNSRHWLLGSFVFLCRAVRRWRGRLGEAFILIPPHLKVKTARQLRHPSPNVGNLSRYCWRLRSKDNTKITACLHQHG